MSFAERLVLAAALAALIVYAATPFAIRLAHQLQFLDKPAGYKGHLAPTPYLGGAAVMAGFLFALLATAGHWEKTGPLAGGVALLWLIGTIDDRRPLSPYPRVLIELALGVAIWAAGLGWHLHIGDAVDLTLTCVWVLGVVNAFNLFDNMDGAASTMALVVCLGPAMIGVARGDVWLAVAAVSLCAACLGFLPRNLSGPARIFLGDGGSMPIGFAVAVLVMVAAGTSTVAWHSLLVALLLVGVPALDMALVIISRRRRGISVLTGGRDHLTHRAQAYLRSERLVALSLGSVQAAVSLVAVLASRGEAPLVVISASLYTLLAGAAIIFLDTQNVEHFPSAEQRAAVGRLALSRRAIAGLLVLGLGAGLSPFFFTYYDSTVWVPIGLALTLLCAIALVVRPARPSGPGALSLFGVLGLGIWSLASSGWAESVENAVVSGNRWIVYGALLLLLLLLISHERRAIVLLGAVAIGIAAVALAVLVRLLGSDPGSLFLGARLNWPLGYINGEGCLFAMGIWPFMAAAERRQPLAAAVGAGLATLMACLALLSQSRGTALALAGSVIVVMALVPGRTRRVYAAMLIAGGVAVAGPDLLHVYERSAGGLVPGDIAHSAGRAALLASIAVGLTWGALTAAWSALSARAQFARGARLLGSRLLVIPAVLVLVAGVSSAHIIDREATRQWHAFAHLSERGESATPSSPSPSQPRLLSGAGNRYDYWRIAWRAWRSHPLIGLGAGNYPRPYFERRSTSEDIQQPHSLDLQVLCELGLTGTLLLMFFVTGVGWGAGRAYHPARASALPRALMTAALGTFTAWLVQTSVDWMHLLPGLTAIAIAAVAALTWQPDRETRSRGSLPERIKATLPRPLVAAGFVCLVLAVITMAASLTRQGLAQLYRDRAQRELAGNPARALTDSGRALYIDADAAQSYYIKAAALARFDRAQGAETALADALAHEPGNFVTWTLLGDISLRQRKLDVAQRYYARAHELNPRNLTVGELALHPAVGLH